MKRQLALVVLAALAGCHRSGVADVTRDADAAQREATAAKTLGDLTAAEAASRGPAPIVHDKPPQSAEPAPSARTSAPVDPVSAPPPEPDAPPANDSAPSED